jgi:hypothetical protein
VKRQEIKLRNRRSAAEGFRTAGRVGIRAGVLGLLAGVAALLLHSAAWAKAQSGTPNPYDPPRLADGHPNLQGLWQGGFVGGFPPGVGPKQKPGADSKPPASLFKIFPDLPYLPEALAAKQDFIQHHPYDDPIAHCHTSGVPRGTMEPPYPLQIVQDGSYVVILYEFVHQVRIIPADGSPHPAGYSAVDGDSRGHWEGNTLVVDVANFNGKARLAMSGDFVDANEHAVERWTLSDADVLSYSVTVEDTTVFSKPWTVHKDLYRLLKTDQILEDACREGERDTEHYPPEYGGKAK